jgi:deoxyribodipyrimidine photo-lyase
VDVAKAMVELSEVQRRDAGYARRGEELARDADVPAALKALAEDARVTVRRGGAPGRDSGRGECVVYWMQRAQRGRDNHALDKAVDAANALGLPCVVYFACISNFPHANLRHYSFMNAGLRDVEEDCAARGVGFVMRRPPVEEVARFLEEAGAAMVIADENPMRAPEQWRRALETKIAIPYWTVDADVVVPSKLLEKAQYSAGVARPRLYRCLSEFLRPYDNPRAAVGWKRPRGWEHDDPKLDITRGWTEFDRSVKPVEDWVGGHHAAVKRLKMFAGKMLAGYDRERNRPETDGTSKMSPYLHFGNISPLTICLAIEDAVKGAHGAEKAHLKEARDSFFNEIIAWRELSVNFVRYQSKYDSTACADNWAAVTIAKHDRDPRERLYTLKQLEEGRTYDELWNAAQRQMVDYGWMHNYLRMYWAKKVVEWTRDAATAMRWSIYLNDKYFLDGRDPNGYAGVAWAVLGKFDRAWGERAVFGKRRYMSGASTGKKFDSAKYVSRWGG